MLADARPACTPITDSPRLQPAARHVAGSLEPLVQKPLVQERA
jgi:hypothetical protein